MTHKIKAAKFDANNVQHCVIRAMILLSKFERKVTEVGMNWVINNDSCRFAVEHAIINRAEGTTMMQAVEGYVETLYGYIIDVNGYDAI